MLNWFQKTKPSVVEPKECCRREVPVAASNPEWISVESQIPEYGVRVLVFSTQHGVATGNRTSQCKEGDEWELGIIERYGYSLYTSLVRTKKVTHWRPMPSSPSYANGATVSTIKRNIVTQAVEAIVYDLTDRSGLSDEWDAIDEETQVEIKNKWSSIIE